MGKKKTNQQDSEIKRMKDKRDKLPNCILWLVFVAIIIIVIATMAVMIMLCIDSGNNSPQDNNGKMESTLLASGLSIIGIAISVWAGLNIIQVLGKDKINQLYEEVTRSKEERYILNREEFINHIERNRDELNVYLQTMFRKMEVREEDASGISELYFACTVIEDQFQLFYLQHYQKLTLSEEKCQEVINRIENKLTQLKGSTISSKDIFIKYLKLRKAEIYFYSGYDSSKDDSFNSFLNARDIYSEVFQLPIEPANINNECCAGFTPIEFKVYMLNTMGEIHSKLVQMVDAQGDKEKYGKIAERYYEILMAIIEKNESIQREVFYRNYACLLERMGGENGFESERTKYIRGLHQKAMDIALSGNEPIQIQVRQTPSKLLFKAWLQFYHKEIERFGLLGMVTGNGEKFMNCKECIRNNMNDLKKYVKKARIYSKIAHEIYASDIYYLKMQAFAEQDMLLLLLMEEKDAEDVYFRLEKMLEDIQLVLVVEDDYSRALKNNFEEIRNYLNKHKVFQNILDSKYKKDTLPNSASDFMENQHVKYFSGLGGSIISDTTYILIGDTQSLNDLKLCKNRVDSDS
ncbi:MAG: hypothetical protein K2O03_06770 [Lachnospiraceae bacterium]|nr:hypothetical protein [Lachnospiraceae bacterium]